MTELGLEPGQVATACGFIYIYHPEYGISQVQQLTLEPYLAIMKIIPIDSSSVAVNRLRRLDFSEFERMGFAIEFHLSPADEHYGNEDNNRIESPPLTWFVDDSEDQERFSDEHEFGSSAREHERSLPDAATIRKRPHAPDFSSPILEKRSRQPKDFQSRRTPKYACSKCDMEFTNAKLFRRHTRMYNHVGTEKPFQCDACGKPFRWKEDRDLHFRLYHRQKEKEEESSPWIGRIHETTMQLPMLQINPIKSFEQAANIIAFEADEMAKKDESKVCNAVPQYCPGPSATYLVDLTKLNHPDDIVRDSYGMWGRSSNQNGFYSIDVETKSLTRLNKVEKGGTKRKLAENAKIDFKARRRSYWHPQEKQFRKSIFLGYFDEKFTVPSWAIVSYEWLCTPYEFSNKPHGNRKYNKNKPYQPTAKSVLKLLGERASHLTPKQNVQLVSEKMDEAVGPAFVPRDNKQAHNQGFQKRLHEIT